jgi:hypothetical protein
MQLLFMKIIIYGVNIIYIPGLTIIYMIAYFSQEDRFYFLTILFYYSIGVYVALKVLSPLCLSIFMGYSTFEYLIMRYKQINQEFKSITNGDLNSLEALIKAHNEVTLMLKNCDLLFSKLLGVAYFYNRFLINILLFISIYGNSLIYARIISSVFAVFMIIGMYIMFYMPAKVWTETYRC